MKRVAYFDAASEGRAERVQRLENEKEKEVNGQKGANDSLVSA